MRLPGMTCGRLGEPVPVGLQLIGNYFDEARCARGPRAAAGTECTRRCRAGGRHDPAPLISGWEVVIA